MSSANYQSGALARELLALLPAFHRAFGRAFDAARREGKPPTGQLGKNQEHALHILSKHEGMIQTTLGACLHLERGSLTSLVDTLAERQLLERSPDPQDRRKVHLNLTPLGRSHVARQTSVLEGYINEQITVLPDPAREQLEQGLSLVMGPLRMIIEQGENQR